jgi:hypothetical protein
LLHGRQNTEFRQNNQSHIAFIMTWIANLRKMRTLKPDNELVPIAYELPLFDVLEANGGLAIHEWVGRNVRIEWQKAIHCVETGAPIRKTYGDGLSYKAWLKSPSAVASVIRPELSRIHEGIALRDEAWEREHHLQPHVVYISFTGGLKVGVTRETNVPFRWHDQGAVAAIVLAEVPYRQLAGAIEVELKEVMPDKTNWRKMLQEQKPDLDSLLQAKDQAFDNLSPAYEPFFSDNDHVTSIAYPVEQYPEKVSSVKLDKTGLIEGRLVGIKGQYLIWESGEVLNVRSHAGYRVQIDVN